jgi:acyl-CoA synthetase (AMP-forming)/AMP-acid ligase II
VQLAACIGVSHQKWDERPVVVVVKREQMSLDKDELLQFYEGKVAKWQIPDDVIFVDAIPLGATGKMLKSKVRQMPEVAAYCALAASQLQPRQ